MFLLLLIKMSQIDPNQDKMNEELRKKESANMSAFLNSRVESVLKEQRSKAKWCFDRSYQNLDKFLQCYEPFHEHVTTRLPIYYEGLNWASYQFNTCIKDSKVPDQCYQRFKTNVQHFTDIGKFTSD